MTRTKAEGFRSLQPLFSHTHTHSGEKKKEKPSTACVLSCVVGSGPPARTTSHRYLLVSVSLGGKSISFRRYCADSFVQAPKRSPHPYPAIPGKQKEEKERGDGENR